MTVGPNPSRSDPLESVASGFSHPWNSLDRDLFQASTAGWAAIVIREYLERSGAALEDCTRQFLEAAAQGGIPERAAVDPAFGALAETLAGRANGAAVAAVCLVLRDAGLKGEWSVRSSGRSRLRWRNQVVPVCRAFDSRQTTPQGGVAFPRLEREDILCWNLEIAAAEDLRTVPRPLRRQLRGADPALLEAAFDLMRNHASRYAQWVRRITRVVLLQSSARGLMESGSYPTRVGMIRVSADNRPAAVAEMLVHEACHQYFYVLRRLGDFFAEGAAASYYSPLKRRKRPLEKLLLGFHAFGNVLLLHRRLGERGASGGVTPQMLAATERETRMMWSVLSEHAVFSSLGRALFLPLQERLGW